VAVHLVASAIDVRPGTGQLARIEQREKPLLQEAQDDVGAERPA